MFIRLATCQNLTACVSNNFTSKRLTFQIFQERLSSLSFNDWERVAKNYNSTQTLKF